MQNKLGTLWLIGAGNMGGALLKRWLAADIFERAVIIDPADTPPPAGAERRDSLAAADGTPDYIVLAVKPHIAAKATEGLADRISDDTVTISVMAGLGLETLGQMVGRGHVVRAMPNTPSQIGEGVTGLYGETLNEAERKNVARIFETVGDAHWLAQESDFDALTAVSGSGPAYVFRMVEALSAAGEWAGLDAELARKLARQTVIGAGALLASDPRTAGELRRAVTSPGGTTEAGLEALDEEPGLPAIMRNVVRAASQRSRELAQQADSSAG